MKILLTQQLFTPDPSHRKSTPGKGIGSVGGLLPFFFTRFLMILALSGFGSISANASGGIPARLPRTIVLKTVMPANSLPVTILLPTISKSLRIPSSEFS